MADKFRFDLLTARLQKRGYNALIIQLNPEPKFWATVEDNHLEDSFAMALTMIADYFSAKSGGKYTDRDVLRSFLDGVIAKAMALQRAKRKDEMEFTDEEREIMDAVKKIANASVIDAINDDGEGNGFA
jgi:hypothetical protein